MERFITGGRGGREREKNTCITGATRIKLYIILKYPIKYCNMQVILIELFRGSSLSLSLSLARAQKILLCLNIDRKDYRNSTRSTIDWIFFSKNWPHDTVSRKEK